MLPNTQTSLFVSTEFGPVVARGIGCGESLSRFLFLHTYVSPRQDHVRIVSTCVGLASHLCHMWSSLSNLQRFLTLSNGAAIRQCAFLTTPRPVGPPCELLANLVRVVDPVMSSNATNMAATFAHMQTPCHWFLHTSPPTNMAVRSVPVSACRLLVFTRLTEGAVFVGCCDANGGCT